MRSRAQAPPYLRRLLPQGMAVECGQRAHDVSGNAPVIRLKVVLFPGAVGPINPMIRLLLHLEVDVVDRDETAEGFRAS